MVQTVRVSHALTGGPVPGSQMRERVKSEGARARKEPAMEIIADWLQNSGSVENPGSRQQCVAQPVSVILGATPCCTLNVVKMATSIFYVLYHKLPHSNLIYPRPLNAILSMDELHGV